MTYINPIERCFQKLKAAGKTPLILHSGNPNQQGIHFPKDILRNAYQKAIAEHSYQAEPRGLFSARQSISRYYQTKHCHIPAEQILLTSGTSESFAFLFRLFSSKKDEHILAPLPGYPLFDHIADYTQSQLRYYSLVPQSPHWNIDWKLLEQQWNPHTKAIIVISPHNPTGWVAKTEDWEKISQLCIKYNTALICDEVFSEFYFSQNSYTHAAQLNKAPLCFTLNGISKMLASPGLKLGWIGVTGNTTLVSEALEKLEIYNDTFLSANGLIQQALPELIQNSSDFLKGYCHQVQNQAEHAIKLLNSCPQITVHQPEGGFYLMAQLSQKLDLSEEAWVIQLMQEAGVFVYPAYFYDYESEYIHFVLSFLTEETKLKLGLEKIIAFIQKK
ncbi:MAG: pyridoxal phosphate-dependent aminotransferase [Deltaproteobacteria bacterium]|nr:pyridoxal phosphate-dependent aminotransferase [Deltaproteobacteria bacterium]